MVTPRLTLRYVTDELATELALLAACGIHDPSSMPFSTPWTDVDSPELERNALKHFWRNRAETTAEHWSLNLAADVDGTVVGMCAVDAEHFAEHRSAETGSWIGLHHQRRGLGREVRHAALHLIFAGLDAARATTKVWHDNVASLAVTQSLPYVQTGSSVQRRRDHDDRLLHFAMNVDQWQTVRRHDISLNGVAPVRHQLQTESAAS